MRALRRAAAALFAASHRTPSANGGRASELVAAGITRPPRRGPASSVLLPRISARRTAALLPAAVALAAAALVFAPGSAQAQSTGPLWSATLMVAEPGTYFPGQVGYWKTEGFGDLLQDDGSRASPSISPQDPEATATVEEIVLHSSGKLDLAASWTTKGVRPSGSFKLCINAKSFAWNPWASDSSGLRYTYHNNTGLSWTAGSRHRLALVTNSQDCGVTGLTVSKSRVTLVEGDDPATYEVVLTEDPGTGRTVTVTPASSATGTVTVSGALTFTGGASGTWATPQTVTVRAVDDSVRNPAGRTATITHSVTGYPSITSAASVRVTVQDDEVPAVADLIEVRPVARKTDRLAVVWSAAAGESAVIQWRTAGQTFSGTRRAAVSDTSASPVVIPNLDAGTTYTVRIRVSDGQRVVKQDEATATTLPMMGAVTVAPSLVSTTALEVSWPNLPGNAGYQVRWKGPGQSYNLLEAPIAGDRRLVTADNATSHTITGLTAGTAYDVDVTELVEIDGETEFGDRARASASTSTRFGAVGADAVANDPTALDLTWTAPPGATAYVISWKSGSQDHAASRRASLDRAASSYRLTGLDPGTTYSVAVAAGSRRGSTFVASGLGDGSGTTGSAPPALAGLAVAPVIRDSTKLDVTWTAVPSADSYVVEWKSGDGAYSDAARASLGSAATTYRISGLATGTAHRVRVTAYAGSTPPRIVALGEADGLTNPLPGTVEVSGAAGTTTKLDVAWPAFGGRSGYRVQWKPAGAASFPPGNRSDVAAVPAGPARTTISDLAAGTAYDVKVTARHVIAGRTFDGRSAAGSGTTFPAMGTVGASPVADTGTELAVTWPAVAGASGYRVQWKGPGEAYSASERVFGAGPGAVAYTISGLTAGTAYDVRVTARHMPGAREVDGDSGEARGRTRAGTGGLSGLAVSAPAGVLDALDVSWTAFAGASGYVVQWKTGAEGYSASARRHAVGSDATSYRITGLDPGTAYTVRVAARDDSDPPAVLAYAEAGRTTNALSPDLTVTPVPGDGTSLRVSWSLLPEGENCTVSYKPAGQAGDYLLGLTIGCSDRQDVRVGLTPGATYLFRILVETQAIIDERGVALVDPQMLATDEAAGTTHSAPADLAVTAAPGSTTALDVSWTPVPGGAASYRVQWRKTAGGTYGDTDRANPSAASVRITDLEPGTDYTVRVTPIVTGDLAAPDGLTAEASGATHGALAGGVDLAPVPGSPTELAVSWANVAGNAGYRVQWRLASALTYSTVGDVHVTAADATGYRLTGLTPGTAYEVKVTVLAAAGEGTVDGDSATARATTDALVPGVTVTPVAGSTEGLAVAWSAFAGAAGYVVQWKGPGEAYSASERRAELGADARAHTITGLTAGTAYEVRVTAYGMADFTEYLAQGKAGATTHGAVAGLAVAPVAGSTTALAVSWTAVPGAVSYRVQWKTAGGTYDDTNRANPTTARHVIEGLSPATAYDVRVTGIVAGTVAAPDGLSAESSGTTHAALTGLGVAAVTGSETALEVTWTAVASAAGYRVQWKGPGQAYSESERVHAAGSGATSYTISGLLAGTEYVVRVTARVTVAGQTVDGGSAAGAGTTGTGLAGLAVAPVAGSTTELAVSWDAVADADTYRVRWKSGGGGYGSGRDATGTSDVVPGLTAGTVYTVQVTAVDTDANPDAELARGLASAATFPALGAVEAAPAAGRSDALDVTWPAAAGASGYRVQWKTGVESYSTSERVHVAAAGATGYRITGLAAGTAHDVRVTARHAVGGGVLDGDSGEADATTHAALAGLAVAPAAGSMTALAVSWTAVPAATGYVVQWKTGGQAYSESERVHTAAADATGYTIAGLAAGTAYTVRVTARHGTGAEAHDGASAEAVATMAASLGTVGVSAAPGRSDALDVVWAAYAGAAGYRVQWKTGAEVYSTSERVHAAAAGATSYTIEGLTAGTAYTVRVTALDGSSPARVLAFTEAEGATLAGLGAVDVAPVSGESTELAVTWPAVAGASGYRVQWKIDTGSYSTSERSFDAGAGTTSYTVSGLSADTAYDVKVTARHTFGSVTVDGDAGEASATTHAALAGLGVAPVSGSTTALAVRWTAVAGATGYRVQWKTGTDSYSTSERVHAAASGATSYRITGLTAAAGYDVRVTARVTVAGKTVDGDAAEVSGTYPWLGTVTVAAVANTGTELSVTWPAVAGVLGYRVQWKTGTESYGTRARHYPGSYRSRERLFDAGAGTTSYTISGLEPRTTYAVRVTAVAAERPVAGSAAQGSATTGAASGGLAGLAVSPVTGRLDALDVTWTAHAGAAEHVVQWKGPRQAYSTSARRHAAGATATSYRITGLAADTGYSVRVTARDDASPPAVLAYGEASGRTNVTHTVGITIDRGGVPEGETVGFQVGLFAPNSVPLPAPAGGLTVHFTVADATGGGDYLAASEEGAKTVTVAAGESGAWYEIPTVDDGEDEPDGRIGIELQPGTGYVVLGVSRSIGLSVLDNDLSALVTASKAAVTVSEADDTTTTGTKENEATYEVALAADPGAGKTVTVTPASSAASVATVSGALTFTTSNWSTPQTVTVTGQDDGAGDPDDRVATVTHTVSGLGGGTRASAGSVRVTVTDAALARVAGLTAGWVSGPLDTLSVAWTAHAGASDHVVQWKTGGQAYSSARQAVLGGTASSHVIAGLASGTSYRVRVLARDGSSPPVVQAYGEVDGSTLAALTGFGVAPVAGNATQLAVTWDLVAGADKYEVRWRTAGRTFHRNNKHDAGSTATSHTITGLLSTLDHDVQVVAYDTDASPAVALAGALGRAGTLGLGVAAVSGDPTKLNVTWRDVVGAHYRVEWKSGSQDYAAARRLEVGGGGSTRSRELTGLDPATAYTVRVTARSDILGELGRAEASATTGTAAALSGLTVAPVAGVGTELAVSWTAHPGAASHVVQWKPSGGEYASTARASLGSAASSHTITGLTAGTGYRVRVVAYDGASPARVVGLAEAGAATHGAPPGLAVSPVAGRSDAIQVTWDALPGAVSYRVQWKTGANAYDTTHRANPTAARHVIEGLAPVTAYDVRVTGIVTGTVSSPDGLTSQASGTTHAALTGLDIAAVPGSMTELAVSWTAVASAVGYRIEWKGPGQSYSESERLHTAGSGATSYTIPGLSGGTAYDVRVTARVTVAGETVDGGSASGSGTTGTGLAGLAASPVSGSATRLSVTWDAVADAELYRVRWKSGGGGYGGGRDTTGTSYVVTGLAPETAYTVEVTAFDTDADPDAELARGEVGAETFAALTGLEVAASAGSATELSVTWDAVSGASGYRVQWRGPGQSYSTSERVFDAGSDATGYTVAGLTAGTRYDVRVTVRHGVGAGAHDGAAATGSATTLPAVVGLTVAAVANTGSELAVSWTAFAGATGYVVQWKTGGESYRTDERVFEAGAGTTSYTIAGLAPGTRYAVRVTAKVAGQAVDTTAAEGSGTTGAAAGGLAGLTVSPVAGRVDALDVTWTAHAGAAEHVVQWKSGAETYSAGERRHAAGAAATGYRITGLTHNTAYTVRVVARDGASPPAVLAYGEASGRTNVTYTVGISRESAAVTEGEAAWFDVWLRDPATGAPILAPPGGLAVNVTVTDVPAFSGSDFLAPEEEGARTVTIAAGESSVRLRIPTVDDDEEESRQHFPVEIEPGPGYVVDRVHRSISVQVLDNDLVLVTALKSAVTVSEADDSATPGTKENEATYTVALALYPGVNRTVTVTPVSSAPSVATVSGPLTFRTSNWSVPQTVTVTGQDDGAGDPDDRVATITHTYAHASFGEQTSTGVVRVTVTDAALAPVAGLTVSPASGRADALSVAWTAHANAADHVVQWKTGGQAYSSARQAVLGGTASSHVISGLASGTSYRVRVLARDGSSPPVVKAFAEVSASTLSALTGFGVAPVAGSATKLAVTWDLVSGADKYEVRWRTAGSSTFPGANKQEAGSTATGHTITGLQSHTSYEVQVVAYDTDASPAVALAGSLGRGLTASTLGLGVAAVSGDPTKLSVTWQEVQGATVYRVEWKSGSQDYAAARRVDAGGSARSRELTGLDPATAYTVRVTASDAQGGELGQEEASATTATAEAALAGLSVAPVSGSGTQLSVTWTAAGGAASHVVQWKPSGGEYSSTARASLGSAASSHTVTGLTAGTGYRVRVVAYDDASPARVVGLAEAGGTTHSAPSGLTVTPVAGRSDALAVTWDALPGAVSYRVQWKTGGNAYDTTHRANPTAARHVIEGLSPATAYDVRVTGVVTGTVGSPDGLTSESSGTTHAALTGLDVAAVPGSMTELAVTWTAVASASGYRVEWKGPGQSYSPSERLHTAGSGATSYTISGLSGGTTYDVRVTARVTVVGETVDGGSASDTGETGTGLAGLAASPVAGSATRLSVTWDAVADAELYRVRWKSGGGGYGSGRDTTGTSYVVTGLSAGTAYTVQVTAIDTDADPDAELAKGEVGAETFAALTGLEVAASAGSATELSVTWDAVSGASGYRVQWRGPGQAYSTSERVHAAAAGATGHTVTGLSAGTRYDVRVTVRHGVGADAHDGAAAVGSATTASALVGLSVSPVAGETTELAVSWTAFAGAAEHVVQWKTGVQEYGASARRRAVGSDATGYRITGLDPGTTYTVRVVARDGSTPAVVLATGEAGGAPFAALGTVTVAAVPATVSELAVTWPAVSGATGYRVQWKTSGGSYSTSERVHTTASGATSYTVSGLTAGTAYDVQVTARHPLDGQTVDGGTAEGSGTTNATAGGLAGLAVSPVAGRVDALEVTWTAHAGAAEHVVQWKAGGESYSASERRHAAGSAATSYTITGLSAGTGYSVRVVARDDASPPADLAYDEAAATTFPALGTVTVAPVAHTGTELSVTWPAVSGATGYRVQWKTRSQDYATRARAFDAGADAASYTISGLTAGTVYEVRVTARHLLAGRTVDGGSSEGRGTTRRAGGLAGLAVSPVAGSGTELSVTWTAHPGAAGHVVQWKTGAETYSANERRHAAGADASSYKITGLTAGAAYTVRVVAEDDASPAAVLAYAEARARTHSAPAGLRLVQVAGSTTALDVEWRPVPGAVSYRVQWKTGGNAYDTTSRANPTAARHRLAGLTAGTAYTVRVTSIVSGTLDSPDGLSSEVSGSVRPPLGGLTVAPPAGQSTTELAVSWSAVGGASGYVVQWKTGAEGYSDTTRRHAAGSGARSHRITGLAEGTTYTVRVTARHGSGGSTTDGATAEARGTTRSGAAGLSVAPVAGSATELAVSWNAVADADLYRVRWKSGGGGYGSGRDTTGTSYVVTGLTTGTAYTVQVTALDTDANPDTELTRGEGSGTTHAALTGLDVVADGATELAVSWTAVAGATGYRVQWKTGVESYSTSERMFTAAAGATGYTIAGLSEDTAYDVRVTALHTVAGSAVDGDSAAVSGRTGLGTLSGFAVAAVAGESTELAVSWTAYAGAEKYRVRWKSGGGAFNTGEETTGTTHAIDGLVAGTAYTVEVTALDTDVSPAKVLAKDGAVVATHVALTGLAVAPVVGSTAELEVTWDTVAGATGYRVQWKTGGGSYSTSERVHTAGSGATSYTIASLAPGTAYDVRVTARHGSGAATVDGDADAASGTTHAALAGLTVAPVSGSTTALAVSWTAVAGATGYRVQWKTGPQAYSTSERVHTAASGATSYRLSGLTAGTGYDVRVTALVTVAGQTVDGGSAEVPGTYPWLGTVTVEAVANTGSELQVSWTAFAGATGYVVQWKTGGESYGTSERVFEAGAGTTSYTISGLSPRTRYVVRVTVQRTVAGRTANGSAAEGSATTGAASSGLAGLTVSPVAGRVDALDVTWAAHAGAAEHVVQWKSGGEIYSDTTRRHAAGAAATGYRITDLTHNTVYTVRVVARDGASPPAVLAHGEASGRTNVTYTAEISRESGVVTEGEVAWFEVWLRDPATRAPLPAPPGGLAVNVTVTDVPAYSGSDFLAPEEEGTRTVTIAAGESSVRFPVPTVDDDEKEGRQHFPVEIEPGPGYVVNRQRAGISVQVLDNEPNPSLPGYEPRWVGSA